MCGARPYTRRFWDALKRHPGGRERRRLPPEAFADLKWWYAQFSDPEWRGSRMWFAESEVPLICMKSDAGGEIACGYHFGGREHMHAYTEAEHARTYQYKELLPVVC